MKTSLCIFSAGVFSIILLCGCAQNNIVNDTEPIGGQRDVHGCLGPAGYSWDAGIGACIRSWELDEAQKKAAKIAVAPLSFPVTVTNVEVYRCPGCFSVHLQRNDNDEAMEIKLYNWTVTTGEVAGGLSVEEAFAIAKSSSCVADGKLTDRYVYNAGTHTWWIDLDAKKEGCSPACVVNEETKTAETNWRCTGLIEPENPARVVGDEEKEVVLGINAFAFDIYRKYASDEGNIFLSPYSISTALAMTYEGAKGATAEEIASVMHFPKDDNLRRRGFSETYKGINMEGKGYKLSTANALWAQKSYPFLAGYLGTIQEYYGGNVTNLDFAGDPEKSRLTINKWVEDQTNDKIKDLIPMGGVNELTRLVLTNAIYFKGDWAIQFDKNLTKEKDFRPSPERVVKAKMMSLTGEKAVFNYGETDSLQVLELPYAGKELSMLILLPKGDNIGLLENSLNEKT